MATLFASDLHLDSESPWAIDAFIAFLEGPARGADALYLLGDLFEVWVGDDDDDTDHARTCAALAKETGLPFVDNSTVREPSARPSGSPILTRSPLRRSAWTPVIRVIQPLP